MCIVAPSGRFVFAAGVLIAQSGLAHSLEFPGTCVKPPATVTNIAGINTRRATMEGRYTPPDITQACNQGYVDQGSYPTPKECIENNRGLVNSPPLHAEADCVAGVVIVEGLRTTLPAHADCASGGIRAIAAFKTLCPSYGGKIERELGQAGSEFEDGGREAQSIADEVHSNASIANSGARKGLIVKMSVAATASNPPTINGTTNLPDGTELVATLTADRPCAPNCGFQAQAVVQNGRFTIPSESIGKIMAGPFTIEIVTPNPQPENVRAVIGRSGEHLEGPYVVTLSKHGWVPRSVNPSDLEKTLGYSIRYVKKINASRTTAPDAYWHRIEADNGAVYAIDVNSVTQNTNGTAVAVTCIVDNDTCHPWNMSRFHFDCRGHYQDLDRHGPVMIAPPRSVAGQMAALACP